MTQKLKLNGERRERGFKKEKKTITKRNNKRGRKITVENVGWSKKKKEIKTATVNKIEKTK